jgi:hypothetical protein
MKGTQKFKIKFGELVHDTQIPNMIHKVHIYGFNTSYLYKILLISNIVTFSHFPIHFIIQFHFSF